MIPKEKPEWFLYFKIMRGGRNVGGRTTPRGKMGYVGGRTTPAFSYISFGDGYPKKNESLIGRKMRYHFEGG